MPQAVPNRHSAEGLQNVKRHRLRLTVPVAFATDKLYSAEADTGTGNSQQLGGGALLASRSLDLVVNRW